MRRRRLPPTRTLSSSQYRAWADNRRKYFNQNDARYKGGLVKRYIVTGTDQRGRRYSAIQTNFPHNYNVHTGTIWELQPDGSRKAIQRTRGGRVSWTKPGWRIDRTVGVRRLPDKSVGPGQNKDGWWR